MFICIVFLRKDEKNGRQEAEISKSKLIHAGFYGAGSSQDKHPKHRVCQ